MKSSVEVVTTPTADSRGTSLMLEFQDKRYLIGNAHEGCQRAMTQRGKRLNKISDVFLTGKTEWKNTGGLLGLVITTADSRVSSRKAALETLQSKRAQKLERLQREISALPEGSKQRASKVEEKERNVPLVPEAQESLGVHGGPNLAYTIATARRFIFRKGVPLKVHESAPDDVAEESQPSWSDENIQVFKMPVLAGHNNVWDAAPECRSLKRDYETFLEREDKTLSKMTSSQNQQLIRGIVDSMFDSDWKIDALTETLLRDVRMPASIFYRDQKNKKIRAWNGVKPGDVPDEELPNVKVLIRKPWPGASISHLPPSEPSDTAMSYIFKNHAQRGRFLPDKAKELGIPQKKFSILTSGKSLTLENGLVVNPQDVMAQGKPGGGFAVVELPSDDYVLPLIRRTEWKSDKIMEGVGAIYWILGPGVADNQDLRGFIEQSHTLKHIMTSPDHSANYIVFESTANVTLQMATVDPDRFPVLAYNNVANASHEVGQIAHPGQILTLEPQLSWDTSAQVSFLDVPKIIQNSISDTETQSLAKQVYEAIRSPAVQKELASQSFPGLENEIITLGTGSAAPSKYRNVSATLLRVPGVGSYLLDAGENTLGQLGRIYGQSALQEVLKDLRMIWISHMHADHHLGITSIIKAWYQAKYPKGTETPMEAVTGDFLRTPADYLNKDKLAVVSSHLMTQWLREYSQVEDYGYNHIVALTAKKLFDVELDNGLRWTTATDDIFLSFNGPDLAVTSALRELTGLVDLQITDVTHCHGSKGVSLTFEDGFKISYSGDCRPSKRFAEIGKGSTVLIHEATFEDDLLGDAKAKKHSTASEAIQVGLEMGAPRIVLTHFSQRYQKLPNMNAVRNHRIQFEDVANADAEDIPLEEAGEDVRGEGQLQTDIAKSDDISEETRDAIQPRGPRTVKAVTNTSSSAGNGDIDTSQSSPGVKIGVAFDYMRVKVKDIALLEKFTPIFSRLFDPREPE